MTQWLADVSRIPLDVYPISEKHYLDTYAEQHTEWVEGHLIEMTPVLDIHDELVRFIENVIQIYLEATQRGGVIRQEPFVMRTATGSMRQPDLMVILPPNLDKLSPTIMEGGADWVMEVLSKDSFERDTQDKRAEYQASGVREYWILDPTGKTHFFYVLDDQGLFQARSVQSGIYQSAVFPELALPMAWLAGQPYPSISVLLGLITAMLERRSHES